MTDKNMELEQLLLLIDTQSPIDSNKTFTLVFVSQNNSWLAGYEAYEDWEFDFYGETPSEAVLKVLEAVQEYKNTHK